MKHAMGFRQFLLRGHAKVTGEWQLLALAYIASGNMRIA